MIFFFFKQKTAYEMRISDWSSDVCSSDLHVAFPHRVETALPFAPGQIPIPDPGKDQHPERQILQSGTVAFDHRFGRGGECADHLSEVLNALGGGPDVPDAVPLLTRGRPCLGIEADNRKSGVEGKRETEG